MQSGHYKLQNYKIIMNSILRLRIKSQKLRIKNENLQLGWNKDRVKKKTTP